MSGRASDGDSIAWGESPVDSLTYSVPFWSTARCTAPNEPLPISCLIVYWLIRCRHCPSSELPEYSECALSVS